MCMIEYAEDGDQCVTLSQVIRKARKAHRCEECRRDIDPGERYEEWVFVVVGLHYERVKCCRHCLIARDWLQAECGGWLGGLVLEDIEEHVTESEGHYGMGVARLVAGMRMKWRHHGKLMRLPHLPPTTHDREKQDGSARVS